MDFIDDPSLVLYLPLYELDGASFMSKDKHGHLATVTGALWTPQGRSFDGVDDMVNVGQPAILNGLTEMTVLAWVKRDRDLVNSAFMGDNGYTTNATMSWVMRDLTNAFGGWIFMVSDGTTVPTVAVYPLPAFGVWFLATGVFKGGSYIDAYIDLVSARTGISITQVNPTRYKDLIVGGKYAEMHKGTIGEVLIYNRALTALEIRRNYLATKWRYV